VRRLTQDGSLLWVGCGAVSELDLVLVSLDTWPKPRAELTATLSEAERDFARRLERPDRWRAARGWLRCVLADRLGADPSELEFTTDAGGKPRIAGDPLRFSLARSGGVALIVTSRTAEVGVDVETVRPIGDLQSVARRFFTPAERRALDGVAPGRRERAFLECWTRKEAYGKATGKGLDYPTDAVELWAGDVRPVTLPGWQVQQPDVGPALVAAISVATDAQESGAPASVGGVALTAVRVF
jgi:4'-phosphopantetheinyl transferase